MTRLLPGVVLAGLLFVGFAAALLVLLVATQLALHENGVDGGPWASDDGDVKRPMFLAHAHNY